MQVVGSTGIPLLLHVDVSGRYPQISRNVGKPCRRHGTVSTAESSVAGISRLFPTPVVLAQANLEDLGLTRTHQDALHQLARGVCEKVIRFDAPGEEFSRMLCALPGVARWIAGYVELRGLGEPDAFPFGDLLLRRLVSNGQKPLTPMALEARAECWRPFRGYAAFHLWAAAEQSRSIE